MLEDQSRTQKYSPKYWHFQAERALTHWGTVLSKEPGSGDPRAQLFRDTAKGQATRETAVKLLNELFTHYFSVEEMNEVRLNWETIEGRFRNRDTARVASVSFASSNAAGSTRPQSPSRAATPPPPAAAPKPSLKEVKMWCSAHLNYIFEIRENAAGSGKLRADRPCKLGQSCPYAHPGLRSMSKQKWLELVGERCQKARQAEVRAAVNVFFT